MLSLVEIVSLTYRSSWSMVEGCQFLVHINTCPSFLSYLCCWDKTLTKTNLIQLTVNYHGKQQQDSRQVLEENGSQIMKKCCSVPRTICPAVRHTQRLVPPTSIINLKKATQTWRAHKSKLMEAIPQWDFLFSGESIVSRWEKLLNSHL